MGLYSRLIFPRLCDLVMNVPRLQGLRAGALAEVRGEILEIGFGTGLNLPHYPASVRRLTTVDPNPGMGRMALRRVAASGIQVDHRRIGGEAMPFADASFDYAVSTWTLCSIAEVEQALSEIRRVLRPGGRFVLLEHGLSSDPGVARWQRRLNPLEGLVADGCRLDRDIEALVRQAGFADVHLEKFELEGLPRTHGTMYRGAATR